MSIRDDLGDRMKKYEYVTRTHLMTRTPVIIRIDGKAFHTFTKGFNKPFDMFFVRVMQDTMKALCENIQGCVLGYTQSDEITLVLTDYKKLNSSAWFDYNIQKCVSITASMATLYFNKFFISEVGDCSLNPIYEKALEKGAMFDARIFNIPKEEVTNCLLWRQNDAIRNSILSVGQKYIPFREMQGKSCGKVKESLKEHGITWEKYSIDLQRGSCCVKNKEKGGWVIDRNIPIFKGEGRTYVENCITFPEAEEVQDDDAD